MADVDDDGINVRAGSFALARTLARCPVCGVQTPVFALGLLPGHQTRDDVDDDDDEAAATWSIAGWPAFLFHLGAVSDTARAAMAGLAATWYPGPDADGNVAWLNHCRACGSVLGDPALFCEPGGFCPVTPADARRIELTILPGPFAAAAAGYAPDPAFFAAVRRV